MANHYVGCITLDMTRYVLGMNLSNAEKRKLVANIIHWGSQFDAPGVHLQLLDGLLDCGFMHLFPLHEHPRYGQYQKIFDQAAKTQVTFLFEQPDQKWAGKDNPVDCYWIGKLDGREEPVNMLCCQPDCKLWPALTGLEEPERVDAFPLFLELAGLADKAGNDSLKGALYHAVTVELGDELEGNFDQKWLPVIERLKGLLLHDAVMERAYGDFAGYDDALLEYDEEYAEQAPNLCGWTKYFCDWYERKRPAALPGGKAPTEIMEQLIAKLQEWTVYTTAYPQNADARHFLAEQLATLIDQSYSVQAQSYVNGLSSLLQSHPDDVFVQHQFMKGLVAPCKTGAVPLSVMAAQHPMFRQTAQAYAANPSVQAEYAQFLYFLVEKACNENQFEQANGCIEELKKLVARHPDCEEISTWSIRALTRRARSQMDGPAITPELEKVCEEFRRATMQPVVTLKLVRRETTIYSSKVGGTPYLPAGCAYPHRGNKPLALLAQLNFEELPHLPGFPEKGILQFYIDGTTNEFYGADFDNLTGSEGFRAVYHEEIDPDPSHLQSPPEMAATDSLMLPFAGEFALEAELTEMPMSYMDFRFDPAFLEIYRRHIPTEATRVWDLLGYEVCSELEGRLPGEGHRMGGYPCFTQQDPRLDDPRYRDYTVLLLQLDTEGTGMEYDICWGDAGVANFFITPQQLERRDFFQVLYTWDCG